MFDYISNDEFELFSKNVTVEAINSAHQVKGKTLLQCAAQENRSTFFSFVISKVIDLKKEQDLEVTGESKVLLEKRLNFLSIEKKAGYSRLHIAIIDDEVKVVEYILRHRLFDINNANVPIGTPLHLAILLGRKSCIETMIVYNPDVDIVNKHNQTPLHMVIEYKLSEMVPGLFELSKNIDIPTNNSMTVLHMAIAYKCHNLLPLILNVGASVFREIQTVDDKSMMKLITKDCLERDPLLPLSKSENCLSLYLKLNGDLDESLKKRLNKKHIDDHDGHGNTLLHLAAMLQNELLCECLIKEGANVNYYNHMGRNPLQELLKHVKLMKHSIKKPVNIGLLLINADSDVNIEGLENNDFINDVLSVNSEKFFIAVLRKAKLIDFSCLDFNAIVRRRWFQACFVALDLMPDNTRMNALNFDNMSFFLTHAKIEEVLAILKGCSSDVIDKIVPQIFQRAADQNLLPIFETVTNIPVMKPELLSTGETIVTHLINVNKIDLVKKLMTSRNRDHFIRQKNKFKQGPLYVSICKQNIELIDIFIVEHENFNDLDSHGNTVLGLLFKNFAREEDAFYLEKTAKLMVSLGASPFTMDSSNKSVIDHCGNEDIKSRIISFAKTKFETSNMKKDLSKRSNEIECKVCISKPVECVLDCGHVFCTDCVRRCKVCPSCRKPTANYKKLYF